MKSLFTKRRLLIFLGVSLAVVLLFVLATRLFGFKPKPAIDISGPDGKGTTHTLSDNYEKSGTMLLFFDTKTDRAMELLEKAVKMTEEYQVDLFAVAVNGDYEEQKKDLEKLGINLPHLLFDESGVMAKIYNVTTTPVSYFIDKNGIIQDARLSSISDKTLKKLLASID